MKFNFKKVVPVLTGAILLGSTIGLATSVAGQTTYPTSFSDAVVVIGSASTDAAPANDIAADLGKLSSSTSLSGENVKIQTSAANLHIGDTLSGVRTTVINHGDLPTLLKKTTFQSRTGTSYDYEQEIKLADGIYFTNFRDDDLATEPVLGIKLAKSAGVVNYTLRFTKNLESSVDSTGRLAEIQDSDIEILGKAYKILNAYNNSNVKLELMGGAVNDILEEGAKKDYVLDGKTYSVEVNFIGETEVKLVVNGEGTTSMVAGGTYKLKDGTELGVRDILYTAKTGSPSKVEFTLGAEKLTLENLQTVEMADTDVDGLTAYIDASSNGAKRTISSIKLQWKTSDKAFVAKDHVLEFPGLKSFKIQSGDLTVPAEETISVKNDGSTAMAVTFPFKSGEKTFDVLYGNGTGFTGIGKDSTHLLRTTDDVQILFNRTTDEAFVATYQSGTATESYLLEARTKQSSGVNYTDVKDLVTGSYVCQDRKPTDTCTIGSVVLTVNVVDYTTDAVNFTAGSGVSFNTTFSEKGLKMHLPTGAITSNSYNLKFVEADKNDNPAAGSAFNVSLGAWTSDGKVQVSSIQGSFAGEGNSVGSNNYFQIGDTDMYVAYVASELGTKLNYDTSPTQDTAVITYHGGETMGNVWITAPGVVAGSALVVKDTELTTGQKASNLVVVGGPAINSIAAELLGLAFPTYGTDPASGFSPDMAQITLFEGKLTPGKVALLVAGYEAKDTQAAAKALIAEKKFGTLKTTTASAYTYA